MRAGILDGEVADHDRPTPDVRAAIQADPGLTDRQRRVLLDVYESFVGEPATPATGAAKRAPRPKTQPKTTSPSTK